MILKIGDKVIAKKSWNKYNELDIERELCGRTYVIEKIGLGLGLVKLKNFIPLVRTKMIKKVKNE